MRILEDGTNRKLFILYLFKKKMKEALNVCLKPSEGSKLTKIHLLQSLANPLKISENINYRKLFILYFRTNETNSPIGV